MKSLSILLDVTSEQIDVLLNDYIVVLILIGLLIVSFAASMDNSLKTEALQSAQLIGGAVAGIVSTLRAAPQSASYCIELPASSDYKVLLLDTFPDDKLPGIVRKAGAIVVYKEGDKKDHIDEMKAFVPVVVPVKLRDAYLEIPRKTSYILRFLKLSDGELSELGYPEGTVFGEILQGDLNHPKCHSTIFTEEDG